MFSVPFNYLKYRNKWNVKLISGCTRHANEKLFNIMYYDNPRPFKGDNGWHKGTLDSNLSFKGSMTGSGQATLQIKVYSQ